jgi:hypothetical protein
MLRTPSTLPPPSPRSTSPRVSHPQHVQHVPWGHASPGCRLPLAHGTVRMTRTHSFIRSCSRSCGRAAHSLIPVHVLKLTLMTPCVLHMFLWLLQCIMTWCSATSTLRPERLVMTRTGSFTASWASGIRAACLLAAQSTCSASPARRALVGTAMTWRPPAVLASAARRLWSAWIPCTDATWPDSRCDDDAATCWPSCEPTFHGTDTLASLCCRARLRNRRGC